jgi:hypothetical protein
LEEGEVISLGEHDDDDAEAELDDIEEDRSTRW